MTWVAVSIQIMKLQPTPQRESHASGEARNVERVSPGHEWSANEGWLDPLRFVLPSSQGNTEMTCYSCAAARNRSMSLIWDNDRSFPRLSHIAAGLRLASNVCCQSANAHKAKYELGRAHTRLSEECSGLKGISWYEGRIRSDCVCVCACVCVCV